MVSTFFWFQSLSRCRNSFQYFLRDGLWSSTRGNKSPCRSARPPPPIPLRCKEGAFFLIDTCHLCPHIHSVQAKSQPPVVLVTKHPAQVSSLPGEANTPTWLWTVAPRSLGLLAQSQSLLVCFLNVLFKTQYPGRLGGAVG